MIILGIDPGTATIGFGVIEARGNKARCIDVGAITTPKTETASWRLQSLHKEVQGLLKKFKPDVVVLEKLYFSKNVTTALSVAQARGVLMLAVEQAGVKLLECSPQEVKMSVTGYGKADKKQVQTMVKVLLNLDKIPKPDDAADALAAALSAINKRF